MVLMGQKLLVVVGVLQDRRVRQDQVEDRLVRQGRREQRVLLVPQERRVLRDRREV